LRPRNPPPAALCHPAPHLLLHLHPVAPPVWYKPSKLLNVNKHQRTTYNTTAGVDLTCRTSMSSPRQHRADAYRRRSSINVSCRFIYSTVACQAEIYPTNRRERNCVLLAIYSMHAMHGGNRTVLLDISPLVSMSCGVVWEKLSFPHLLRWLYPLAFSPSH
jgi:hypothetical protein